MPNITLSAETYVAISSFAKEAGMPVEQAVDEALNEWIDITGESLLQTIRANRARRAKKQPGRSGGKVLPISKAAAKDKKSA